VHLLSRLGERAEVAAPGHEQISNEPTRDPLLLAYLLSEAGHTDQVSDGDELDESTHQARLAHLLGDLAGRVAGHNVSDDADHAVVEASTQTILELVRHCRAVAGGERVEMKKVEHEVESWRRFRQSQASNRCMSSAVQLVLA